MKSKVDSLSGTKRERTRDQLLVSAQSLLMHEGAGALGLRQITTHAGMVHASFYNYYPDVAALQRALHGSRVTRCALWWSRQTLAG